MAKTRRRRPPNRTKSRPPTRAAAPRVGQAQPQPTQRMYVGPSRRARRAQYTRTAAVAGAALGLLIAVLVITRGGGGSLPIRPVTAKVLSTTVQAKPSAGGTVRTLSDGDTVKENAVIETDAAGMGEFQYADGSVFRVGPSSEYSLTKARTNGSRREIASRVVSGKSWQHVAKKSGSSKYEVSVLGATGQVKGTSFAVECSVENDCTYTLVKGKLHLKDAVGHTADMNDGDQVEVKFGRLEPPSHLSDAELGADPWIAQNITLDGGTAPPTSEETTTSLEDTTTTAGGDTTTTLLGATTVPVQPGVTTGTTARSGGTGGTTPPGTNPPGTSPPTTHPATTTPPPPSTSPPTTAAPTTTTTAPKCGRRCK